MLGSTDQELSNVENEQRPKEQIMQNRTAKGASKARLLHPTVTYIMARTNPPEVRTTNAAKHNSFTASLT